MSENIKKIPSVSSLLNQKEIKEAVDSYGRELVVFSIRRTLEQFRNDQTLKTKEISMAEIIRAVLKNIRSITDRTLLPVINATGIVLHTNLGRAPLGEFVLQELKPIVTGYSNLEYDLDRGKRGQRNDHIRDLLKYITGAEDAVVVNNNAAAVLLCLKTFASRKEVIISRGELIEIGGSFRIPKIMKASGAKMVEVGTTNRTRISDYENAITSSTRILFKAHKSNYFIGGFSEEVSLNQLSLLARKYNLLFIYDLGSGLLRKPQGLPLENEPDVKSSLSAGVDIVTFSGDKLLGGPQAGIIAGRKDLVKKISRSPLMRVLRVGKLTLAALRGVIFSYLKDDNLRDNLPLFQLLNRTCETKNDIAKKLVAELKKEEIDSEILSTTAHVGGGSLPELEIKSYAVRVKIRNPRDVFHQLLKLKKPVIGILREGSLMFDVQCLKLEEIKPLAIALQLLIK